MKVWHAKKGPYNYLGDYITELRFPLDYELVAEVATDDVDVAFKLTNHIGQEWWINEGVTAVKKTRSTSCGDVIIANDNKTVYLCLPIGWKKFTGVPQVFHSTVFQTGFNEWLFSDCTKQAGESVVDGE